MPPALQPVMRIVLKAMVHVNQEREQRSGTEDGLHAAQM